MYSSYLVIARQPTDDLYVIIYSNNYVYVYIIYIRYIRYNKAK